MEDLLVRSAQLQQTVRDFVYETEGEVATALEQYSAEQLARSPKFQFQGNQQMQWLLTRFIFEGDAAGQKPYQHFAEQTSTLEERDRSLLKNWQRSFPGLFMVIEVQQNQFELMNWLTAKRYSVQLNPLLDNRQIARIAADEILLSYLQPVDADNWMFVTEPMLLGKLGKPKLAVAVGNFKHDFPDSIYGDAPELLEEAWQSVESYYQEFIDFFGSDQITMPGHQFGQKLQEFQKFITEKRLEAAGLEPGQTLDDLAEKANISKEELLENIEDLGLDPAAAEKVFAQNARSQTQMTTPTVQLPDALKRSQRLTVLVHPRWGQIFLPDFEDFVAIVQNPEQHTTPAAEKLVQHYLKDETVCPFVWHHLASLYPSNLEALLGTVLARPNFDLSNDLDDLLAEFHKPLKPTLPEIASVPLHLHQLFEAAITEVYQTKKKAKKKPTGTKGFGG